MPSSPSTRPTLVVTSIFEPHAVLQALSQGAGRAGWDFVIIGDTKSPANFALAGAEFFSVAQQQALPMRYAKACPTRHYCRKNIGYVLAAMRGAPQIIETDDDNIPFESFFAKRTLRHGAQRVTHGGWVNVYGYYERSGSTAHIWPRGLPLDRVRDALPSPGSAMETECPIQQGLADDNPDVDAVYRLVRPLPFVFEKRGTPLALMPGAWCPFNSQNTTWFPQAYLLTYLPALCSFRMTDIWRSFVAQRIAWENGWPVLFHDATVRQERNEHNLMRDFEDEIPGYRHNAAIAKVLDGLTLASGVEAQSDNMRTCYRALVHAQFLPEGELALLDAWLEDMQRAMGGEFAALVETKPANATIGAGGAR